MRPFLIDWEQRGFVQREIVALLNECGAPIPSEWKDSRETPSPIKQWGLTQYQRFRIKAEEVHMANTFSAKRDGRTNVKPKGDGQGLFARPEMVNASIVNKGIAHKPMAETSTKPSSLADLIATHEQSLATYRAMAKRTRTDEKEMAQHEVLLNFLLDERDRIAAGGSPYSPPPLPAFDAAAKVTLKELPPRKPSKDEKPLPRGWWKALSVDGESMASLYERGQLEADAKKAASRIKQKAAD
jgi:hypothetical protein